MILSIESSCDDSSIAITKIDSKKLIFHKKISQELEHNIYGGVVPELASRLHLEALPLILKQCEEYFPYLKAIAVTNEPGLNVTLMEGVMMAKALSITLNIPLIAINHLKGHIYSLFIEKESKFPQSILLISGGHTMILEALSYDEIKLIASTSDDSFGESFDKVSKMLGLGYPGGPIIEEYAKNGDEMSYTLPIPLSKSPKLEFSYSGLKNAVRLAILDSDISDTKTKQNIAASFQRAATLHIIQKLKKYFKATKVTQLAIVGGASANIYLRQKVQTLCNEFDIELSLVSLEFTSDNAAMIGRAGVDRYLKGIFISLKDLKSASRVSF